MRGGRLIALVLATAMLGGLVLGLVLRHQTMTRRARLQQQQQQQQQQAR